MEGEPQHTRAVNRWQYINISSKRSPPSQPTPVCPNGKKGGGAVSQLILIIKRVLKKTKRGARGAFLKRFLPVSSSPLQGPAAAARAAAKPTIEKSTYFLFCVHANSNE